MVMTLMEYLIKNPTNPLITDDFVQNGYAPFNDSTFMDTLTNWCDFNHGVLQVRPTIVDALEIDGDIIRKRVTNLLKGRQYQYSRLYNSTLLEYKPLENYDMEESGTDDTQTSGTRSTNIGEYSDNMSGTTTNNIGKVDNSSKSTTTEGGSVSHERKVAPFDSDTYAEQELTTDTFNKRTTTNDTITSTNERVDTSTHEDIHNISARQDTSNDTGSHVTEHKLTRHGNIGVTTSQQMLQSEREVAMFNFIGIVAHDIVKSICICIY